MKVPDERHQHVPLPRMPPQLPPPWHEGHVDAQFLPKRPADGQAHGDGRTQTASKTGSERRALKSPLISSIGGPTTALRFQMDELRLGVDIGVSTATAEPVKGLRRLASGDQKAMSDEHGTELVSEHARSRLAANGRMSPL